MKRQILLVTWDGAGNVAPMFGVAARLVRAGHDVRLLGHASLRARVEAIGCAFAPLTHTANWDSKVPVDLSDEVNDLCRALFFNPEIGRDVLAELDRHPVDLAVVDAMLVTAVAAAQTRVPTVSLFHHALSILRGGPLAELLAPWQPALNAFRAELELPPVDVFNEIHDACSLALVAAPLEFEPEFELPANVRYVGPILDGPGLGIEQAEAPSFNQSDNRVLVSLSSSFQNQLDALRRIAAALADAPVDAIITTGNAVNPRDVPSASNVHVRGYVPHDLLLPDVDAVITHGGFGTVMAALAHGLPLLCLPMGRDQFFNAAMVERVGVGRSLPHDATADDIRCALQAVLEDEEMRAAAKRFAGVIARDPGLAGAVREIEAVTRTPMNSTIHKGTRP